MIDLRMANQRSHGHYIYKESYGFLVGKNGTSKHKKFVRADYGSTEEMKRDIRSFIQQ